VSARAVSVRPTRRISVILVDDDADLRCELRALLEATGQVAVTGEAGSAEELIAGLRTWRCDAILLDLSMPGIGGLGALNDLARRPTSPPIVVLTMHDDAASVDRALALGASGYVLKSARPPLLVAALEAAVADESVLDPAIAASLVRRHLRLTPERGWSRSGELSPRQLDVLRGMSIGLGNKEIAHRLGLAEETVKGYVRELYARIGVRSRSAAVAWGARRGVID
jgi:DNA-binding NarL/FixJ family response regulator